ncbi:MAG: 3-oxoacyl-[acyl-carrier-protein] reductase [Acidiferrobacteraceae bacterium]|nr:3-oxoacyl-[acyl-carrier-protein] reductase [Acidiferrobacteraceae bacterium]|tara:strand:- start:962 stop:1726 length:765 start_codon:yes stop_codon:yes gene_type:complete
MQKTALITAGARGIGRAIANQFDAQGYKVCIADIDHDALNRCPAKWHKFLLDVSDESAVDNLFCNLMQDWNHIDVLCANAGIPGPTAPIEEIELADWRKCLSTNLDGAFLFTKYVTPIMKQQQNGVCILISSTAGLYGFMHRAPYVASKWAIIGLMKTLAIELGPYNIRANAICPGGVVGDRLDLVIAREADAKGVSPVEIQDAYLAGTSLGKRITADDVANMAIFLASDNAHLVSGQIIAIDGNTEHPEPKFL